MRKQYHSRLTDEGRFIWDVHRLVALSANFLVKEVALESIRELDEAYWFGEGGSIPTCRAIAEHARLMEETDLKYPIILSKNGRVMDGMHRVAQAFIKGHKTIKALQFEEDPSPDFIDVDLDELSYD